MKCFVLVCFVVVCGIAHKLENQHALGQRAKAGERVSTRQGRDLGRPWSSPGIERDKREGMIIIIVIIIATFIEHSPYTWHL